MISSVTALVQVFNYRRDRAQIVLKVGHDMVITTIPMREADYRERHQPWSKTSDDHLDSARGGCILTIRSSFQTHPGLPHELKEGQKIIAVLPPSDLDMKTVAR